MIKRDRNWVEREYGREKWPTIRQTLDEFDGTLPSALQHTLRTELGRPFHSDRAHFGDTVVSVPRIAAMLAHLGWIAHRVAVEATKLGVDAIVELGAGWGRNLFGAYLAGAPQGAQYVAAELTLAGREACIALAEREPAIELVALPFDYHQLSLALPSKLARIVVFSAHSIEQIPYIGDDFVAFCRQLAPRVRVMHFEPIGWQMHGASSQYAEENDYNRNLWDVLQRSGVSILESQIDVLGVNPRNPTSLVVWE